MALLNYITTGEPGSATVFNRVVKQLMTLSGLAEAADFPGFLVQGKAPAASLGSPEGVVTASPGALYIQTDGARGKTLWRKLVGTGNTGWSLIQGDLAVVNVLDYMTAAERADVVSFTGAVDVTAAINTAYAAAAGAAVATPIAELYLPAGKYKFTSTLVWDKRCSVRGSGFGTILQKTGNFVGIRMDGTNLTAPITFSGFRVLGQNAAGDTSDGIEVNADSSGVSVRDVISQAHGRHGFYIISANMWEFANLSAVLNGGDGIKIDDAVGVRSANSNVFTNLDTRANTGIGFNLEKGQQNHILGLTTQNNTGRGVRIDDNYNFGTFYCEANTAGDCLFDINAASNFVLVLAAASVVDSGTNNQLFDAPRGFFGKLSTSQVRFPAVQVASSDPNTLDDYEEGTFVPEVASGITAITYTAQTGRYTKIGRVVHFSLLITMSAGTRNASQFAVGGLPFSAGDTNGAGMWSYGIPRTVGNNYPTLSIQGASLYGYEADGTAFEGTELSTAVGSIRLFGSYQTA